MSHAIFQCARREISRRKKRSLTTIFGHFLIVSFVVLLTNLLFTVHAAKQKYLNNLGTHFLVYFPKDRIEPASEEQDKRLIDPKIEGFFADPAETRLFPMSVVEQIQALPQVSAASPFLLFRFKEPTNGEIFCLGGFDPGNPKAVNGSSLQKSDIIKGEFLTPQDRGSVLVEEGFAVYRGLVVGSSLKVGTELFSVKGIVRPGIRPAKADLYVRFEDAEQAINSRLMTPLNHEANVVLVEIATASDHSPAMAEVKKRFPDSMINTYDCFHPASQATQIDENSIGLTLAFLAVLLLLFAGKSQLAAVVEKRHDIGIMSAIGWSDTRIFQQLLAEAFLQSLAGSLLGCLFGAGLTLGLSSRFFSGYPAQITASSLAIGLFLAVVGGGLAAALATRSIIAVPPAKNLGRV